MSNSYPHAKIQTSAWQCQCQCLAVQCTLQSSSQGISRCFPRHSQISVRYKNTFARHFLFRGFYLLSCGRVLYRTIFTVDANNNVHTYDCMRIALSLRVHHRAQRLFTIPLRGSAINTEQLCQSIRRFQNFTVRRAICPYCTVGSRLRTDHRCCRAICPYCTVGSFGRHFLLNVMWHGFDQSHFKYILRCYIIRNVKYSRSMGQSWYEWYKTK